VELHEIFSLIFAVKLLVLLVKSPDKTQCLLQNLPWRIISLENLLSSILRLRFTISSWRFAGITPLYWFCLAAF
jgi:hypothetical protein